MNAYALVILALLAFIGKIEARPEDETMLASEEDKKADEVKEKKDDLLKSGEEYIVESPETTVEEINGEKSGEPDPTDSKVKRAATDEVPTQEETGDSSIEGATNATFVNERKSEHDRKDSETSENTETPKIEDREETEEKSAPKIDEKKSSDNVDERSSAIESRENKNPPKEELTGTDEVSTSTKDLQQRSAYGSSSILETKGRLGETGESDNSEVFKGQAHMDLRVPPVNPMAVINKAKDIGSRRMDQPNMMLNFPQQFPPSIQQVVPQTPPPRFNSYLNAAPGLPNVAHASSLAQDQRRYTDVFRPETNAYPYSPASSQQADSLSKFPAIRNLPKSPTFPNNFYQPYDQNYGNFGARPRRYTVPSAPETINFPNKYAYTNFGYPHYIK